MGRFLIITGNDDFARKERARAAALELAGGDIEDNDAVEIVAGDDEARKPEAILSLFLEALRTPPFLAPEKLVWLRHFPDLEALLADQPAAAACREILSRPLEPELAVLIDGPGCDQRKGEVKAWKNAGAVIESCTSAKPGDRKAADARRLNLREFCAAKGKRLDPAATEYLTGALGSDSGLLANELEKLCCYVGDESVITLEDCRRVCSGSAETVSWEFTGAVVARDRARSLELLGLLLARREPEIRLMYALSNEFQKLISTRSAMRELGIERVYAGSFDAIPEEVRAAHPDNPLLKLHPYRAFKVCEAAARCRDASLIRAMQLIQKASRDLVSGNGDPRCVLENVVIALCRV